MAAKKVMIIVWFLLLAAVSGELVVERSPCPGQSAIYRCSVRAEELSWFWNPVGRQQVEFVVISSLTQPGVTSRQIGDQVVLFNITDAESSYINVVATVTEPVSLDGTRMTCAGQDQIIRVPQTSLVPTALRIMRLSHNGSEVYIHPITEGDTNSGISYQLSSSVSVTPWTSPIVLAAPNVITFFHCQYNGTFTVDACLIQDDPMERNYTLFMNETWAISRRCSPPEILVNCSDERWSEDITCSEIVSTTSPELDSTNSPEIDLTTSPNSSDSTSDLPVNTSAGTIGTTTSSSTDQLGRNPNPSIYVGVGIGVGVILATILFILVILVILLCVKKNKRKKISLEEVELNRLEEESNEYSTLNHPTPARSMMSADAYDTINRQPPEAPSYGILNGNAATAQDRHQNRLQDRVQDRSQDRGLDRFQDRAQDRDSDTDSHQYAKTKHIPQKSKSNDMMYSEVATRGQDSLHPHLTTGSGVQYSGIQHGVRPEDGSLNLDSLLIQLRPVTDQYQELGVAAGLSQETIEEITSHAAVAFDGLVEVCDAWIRLLKRQDTTPTWRAVSDMLQKIGQEKLARDLLKVYTTGALPVMVDMHTVEIPKQATQSPPPPVPLRNDVDMDADGEVAMATVVSLRRDRMPTESAMSPPPPIPPFHPNEDQAIAVPPRPPKKGAPQPGAPAIPPKILPPKPSPNSTPEAVPSLPPKPNKKA